MEAGFEKQAGVLSAVSGYTGGGLKDPDYKTVSEGNSGHYEAVRISYDPQIVSYQQLLAVYWRNIDPLDDQGLLQKESPAPSNLSLALWSGSVTGSRYGGGNTYWAAKLSPVGKRNTWPMRMRWRLLSPFQATNSLTDVS